MIVITKKEDCCGCSACMQRCPKQCISMKVDEEGFLYPSVDDSLCIDCGLCEKVCPMLHRYEKAKPISVFAASNPDGTEKFKSSSGGVFPMLARKIIEDGGVVFGAVWNDEWLVEHKPIETIGELSRLQGSKYLQSKIGNTYHLADNYLKKQRKVLFSGTPCQIAGLKLFLQKDYPNLLTVETVCHSVPSPGIWKKYLSELLRKERRNISDIRSINHRDKCSGWKGYSCSLYFKNDATYVASKDEDLWMRGFMRGLYTRPSCVNCPAKIEHSYADITLGDLWGIARLAPEIDDDKGMSMVSVSTKKGQQALKEIGVQALKNFTLVDIARENPAVIRSFPQSHQRTEFYRRINNGKSILSTIKSMSKFPLRKRVHNVILSVKSYVVSKIL